MAESTPNTSSPKTSETPKSKSRRSKSKLSPVVRKNSFCYPSKNDSVPVSPVSTIGQRGNLTGLPRTVRDAVAELYNNVQRWNKHHAEGCVIVTKIAETKKTEGFQEPSEKIFEPLQDLCDALEICIEMMANIVEAMQRIAKEMGAVKNLAEFQGKNDAPLFLTWPLERFESTAEDLASAYSSELEVKRLVLRKAALSKTESETTFYLSCWIHQPAVSYPALELKLKAALLETGHH